MNLNYSIVILNIPEVLWYFKNNIGGIYNEYSLTVTDREHLYDWLVTEALDRMFRHQHRTKVSSHFRHDVYKCVYDQHGEFIFTMIYNKLKAHKLKFMIGEEIKVMVVAENVFIARGIR
jgi:hypothetical protein